MSLFDTSRLNVHSAVNRRSKVWLNARPEGDGADFGFSDKFIEILARKPRIWFLGGHVFKANLSWYLIELMKMGFIDHIAITGAGLVHDWELAMLGHTSEDVASAIKDGSFGLWHEIGLLNDVAHFAAYRKVGLGEKAGEQIQRRFSDRRSSSVLATAYELKVPVTVHVAIGQDVFFGHPNCDGGAWGASSYKDFLTFAAAVEKMQGGSYLSFGSAVASPEVFLKALAMARNANAGKPDDLATVVFDCVRPPEHDADIYFYRPSKTLLKRVTENSTFVYGRHEQTIPAIWKWFTQ